VDVGSQILEEEMEKVKLKKNGGAVNGKEDP